MTDEELDEIFTLLDGGATLEVPLRTPLFPETEAIRTTLARREGGDYVLRTTFREHAAGHGWSGEQVEEQVLDAEALKARLYYASRAKFVAG